MFVNANCTKRNRGKVDTLSTQIHDHSFFWLDTGTSIKSIGLN